jgi:hypothetical protein
MNCLTFTINAFILLKKRGMGFPGTAATADDSYRNKGGGSKK